MSDDQNQKQEGDGGEEQGETRNDVVVKIGLVGDAQVPQLRNNFITHHNLTSDVVAVVKIGW